MTDWDDVSKLDKSWNVERVNFTSRTIFCLDAKRCYYFSTDIDELSTFISIDLLKEYRLGLKIKKFLIDN